MADKGKKRKGAGGEEPAKKKAKQETASAGSEDPTSILEPFSEQFRELAKQEEKEHKAIQAKFSKQRKPIYKKRDAAVAGVEGFWSKALLGHPTIRMLMSAHEIDHKLAAFITKIEFDETELPSNYKMTFHFKPNDLIKDKTLTRSQSIVENEDDDEVEIKVEAGGINWKAKDVPEDSFFNMMFAKESPASADMASLADEIQEIYGNPLPFFKGEVADSDDDSDGEAPTLVEDDGDD